MYKYFKVEIQETDAGNKVLYKEYNGYAWLPEYSTGMEWAVKRLATRCTAAKPYKTSQEAWDEQSEGEDFDPKKWDFWASALEDVSGIQKDAKVGLYYQYLYSPDGSYFLRVWQEVQISQKLIGYGLDDSRYSARTGMVETLSTGNWEYQKVETIYPAGFSAGWIVQEFLDSVALYFWNRQSSRKIEYTI